MTTAPDVVERYLELGLRLGRHLDGLVDAYYGPAALADRVAAEPVRPLAALRADATRLAADVAAGADGLEARRARWLEGQLAGLAVVAAKLDGQAIGYVDEVEACYGVTPRWVDEDVLAAAHERLEQALPGTAPLAERYVAWRESHAVPVEVLPDVLDALAAELRARTDAAFGLPDGEAVDFALVRDRPWSGFNHYLGGLRSRVELNVDLPVLSLSLPHLVAHEAYPGHHTEHVHKEVGLVRRRGQLEESIFLVGTPQCLLAEGLADLALEALVGERPLLALAPVLEAAGAFIDAGTATAVAEAAEHLSAVRGNAALLLHDRGATEDEAVEHLRRWGLLSEARARQAVRFLVDPTWRAYISCYVEGLPLCRGWVAGRPDRFARLLDEQLLPADLAA